MALAAGFVALLVVAELWRKLRRPSAEATRKLAHLGSGLGCLALPFLIRSPWVVLGLALAMAGAFALSQRLRVLPSLHAVERKSRGSEYYPLAIFLVYVIAYDRPALYVSSVLVLAVADAGAALVGVRYGSVHYEVEDSKKSVEGSLIFLVIAFLAIHLPLLLMTDLPRAHCVLSALLVASLVTLFEAISLGGADNLFIPIAVAVCLDKITSKPVGEAEYQVLSLLVLAILLLGLARRFRWFNTGATMVALLYAYGAWALGGWLWSAPLVLALVASLAVGLRAGSRTSGTVKVRYLAGVALPPFLFVMAGDGLPGSGDLYFGPYLAVLGATIVFWVRAHSRLFRDGAQLGKTSLVAAFAFVCIAPLPWLFEPGHRLEPLLGCAGAIFVATMAEATWTQLFAREPQPPRWTARRFNFALLAGLLVFALQHFVGFPSWHPSQAPDPQRWFWNGRAITSHRSPPAAAALDPGPCRVGKLAPHRGPR